MTDKDKKEVTPDTIADKVLNEGVGSVWMETGEPQLEILSEGEIKGRLARIMCDGENWIIVSGLNGMQALMKFEEQFYWNEANADFEIVGLFNKGLHIALARKSRCDAAQMADFINARMKAVGDTRGIEITEAVMSQRDVLFWADEAEGDLLADIFFEWINEAVTREQASRN